MPSGAAFDRTHAGSNRWLRPRSPDFGAGGTVERVESFGVGGVDDAVEAGSEEGRRWFAARHPGLRLGWRLVGGEHHGFVRDLWWTSCRSAEAQSGGLEDGCTDSDSDAVRAYARREWITQQERWPGI